MIKDWRKTWKQYSMIHCIYYMFKERYSGRLKILLFVILDLFILIGGVKLFFDEYYVFNYNFQFGVLFGCIYMSLYTYFYEQGIYKLYRFSGIVILEHDIVRIKETNQIGELIKWSKNKISVGLNNGELIDVKRKDIERVFV